MTDDRLEVSAHGLLSLLAAIEDRHLSPREQVQHRQVSDDPASHSHPMAGFSWTHDEQGRRRLNRPTGEELAVRRQRESVFAELVGNLPGVGDPRIRLSKGVNSRVRWKDGRPTVTQGGRTFVGTEHATFVHADGQVAEYRRGELVSVKPEEKS